MSPYGYDYNGQEVVFSPLLLFDRVAYHVLMYMTQGDIFVVKTDVRKSLFRILANIFGRQLISVRPDVNPNFRASCISHILFRALIFSNTNCFLQESLVGGLLTNSWLLIESLDFLQVKTVVTTFDLSYDTVSTKLTHLIRPTNRTT